MALVTIALDAMGGDHGPPVIVPASLQILAQHPNLVLILVGKRDSLEAELAREGQSENPRLLIHEASQIVEMGESPAVALRKKRDSSMRVAINLVKEGRAQACVSAGNTGALMANARFVLKTLPGIDRPAIVSALPSMYGHVHVLDLGANVDSSAEDLVQFAVMGSILAIAVDNKPNPRVGLLNIGTELIKGSELIKRTSELLVKLGSRINYIGFVEGDDIYKGTADVIVTDGFVGNVALKASEGLAKMMIRLAKEEFKSSWYGKMAGLIASPVLKGLMKRIDPARYNGASLLGLRGIVIKSHGNADQNSFANAIRIAILEVEKNIPEKIQNEINMRLGLVT